MHDLERLLRHTRLDRLPLILDRLLLLLSRQFVNGALWEDLNGTPASVPIPRSLPLVAVGVLQSLDGVVDEDCVVVCRQVLGVLVSVGGRLFYSAILNDHDHHVGALPWTSRGRDMLRVKLADAANPSRGMRCVLARHAHYLFAPQRPRATHIGTTSRNRITIRVEIDMLTVDAHGHKHVGIRQVSTRVVRSVTTLPTPLMALLSTYAFPIMAWALIIRSRRCLLSLLGVLAHHGARWPRVAAPRHRWRLLLGLQSI